MNRFIVRVELHNADAAKYDILHEAMRLAGFQRFVRSSLISDDWAHLPTAEYYIESPATVNQIRDLAKQAAGTTGCTYILVAVQAEAIAYWLVPYKKKAS